MATILSVTEIIEIGRASTYLSANYTSKQTLFGGSVIKPPPPVQIAFVTDALDWGNSGGAQTAASLRSTANYLYWLCGLFQLQAQNIISGPGGGSVIPATPGGSTSIYPFIITSSDFESDGKTYINLDIVGDNFMLFINEWTQQWLTAPGAFSYTSNGFTINNGVGEQMDGFNANTNSYTIIVQQLNNG